MTPRQITIDALREAFMRGNATDVSNVTKLGNKHAEAAADALLAKLSAAMVPVTWMADENGWQRYRSNGEMRAFHSDPHKTGWTPLYAAPPGGTAPEGDT